MDHLSPSVDGGQDELGQAGQGLRPLAYKGQQVGLDGDRISRTNIAQIGHTVASNEFIGGGKEKADTTRSSPGIDVHLVVLASHAPSCSAPSPTPY